LVCRYFFVASNLAEKINMSAEIIDLPVIRIERNRGNGARDVLIDVGGLLPNTSTEDAEKWADWLLAEFWARGFKVVPVE
jgi:hypothetical protein